MINNPIHTLENVVISLLSEKECDLQKIREYFNQRFAPEQDVLIEDFKRAYMHIRTFTPNKEAGNQKLIYKTLQGRFVLQRKQLLSGYKAKLSVVDESEKRSLTDGIHMLEMLPDML